MDGRSERGIGASTVEVATASLRRISWGAVFAGTVVVIAVWLTLAMLGMAVGLAAVDPGATNERGIATGAMIWWIISSLIALFIGGWAAGRLAGPQRRLDGALHGVATWGVSALVTVFLLTSTVGSLVGGAFGIVGNVVQANAPMMMRMMDNRGHIAGDYHSGYDGRGRMDRDWDRGTMRGAMDRDRDRDRVYSDRDYSADVRSGRTGVSGSVGAGDTRISGSTTRIDTSTQIAGRITTGTGTSGMGTMDRTTTDMETDRTSTMGTAANDAREDIRREARQMTQSARAGANVATDQVDQAVDMLVMQARQSAERVDREAITNILVTAGVERSDARAAVDRWVDRVRNLRSDEADATVRNAGDRAEVAAYNAADVASKAAMWAFIMMLLGLGAAILGGAIGSPRDIAVVSATTTVPPPPPVA